PPALLERRFLRVPGPRPLPLGLVESADRFFDDPHVVGHGRVLLLRAWKEPTRDPDLVGEDLRPQVAEDLEEPGRRVEEPAFLIQPGDQVREVPEIGAEPVGRDIVVQSHDRPPPASNPQPAARRRPPPHASAHAVAIAGDGQGRYRMNVDRTPTSLSSTSSPPSSFAS